MNRMFLFIFGLVMALSTQAQITSMVEISMGGGWSSLGYSVNTDGQSQMTAKQLGSYGLDAHIGYGLFFNPYVGFGLGIDCSRYGSMVQLGGKMQWDAIDSEEEPYTHIATIQSWQDKQELVMIELPLSLYFRAPFADERTWFSGAVGARMGIPVFSTASYNGTVTHSGFYAPWSLVLDDVPAHGFTSETMDGAYNIYPQKYSFAAFVKLGFETALNNRKTCFFFGHLYGTYYFINTLQLTSKYKGNRALPLQTGLEVGIRFRLPHKAQSICHCN